MHHIATIAAFPNKFGTFTGVVLDKTTGERIADRFATLEDAKNFAKRTTGEKYGAVNLAPLRRKGEYQANVWA